jgi:NAD(P)-dependent dehydrogenase (short-subunit alcohol dehydrogenase family)
MRLQGKVVVVTGAASGNGRAIAARCATEGADLVLGDLDLDGLDGTTSLAVDAGRAAIGLRCDVTSRDDLATLVAAGAERFGRVDVMVANAGISRGAPFLSMDQATWQAVIDVNLTGVFLSDQVAALQMVDQGGGGAIVNIASIMARLGSDRGANYCAAKAGVESLTKSAALALAPHGIRVNAIGPGFIETPMTQPLRDEAALGENLLRRTPMGRMGTPDEVAAVAAFLASDDASFMTGQCVFPDGGFLLNWAQPTPEMAEAALRLGPATIPADRRSG